MNVFVDTSVWSLALRRDQPQPVQEVERLRVLLRDGESIFTTGLVLQELLQGFQGPKQEQLILENLSSFAFIVPQREDYVEAAWLRNGCRRKGIQIGTIDALLARLCMAYKLQLLTADRDFHRMAQVFPLNILH
ncbi:MAG: PIN domain-containing protein [Acidobacteria bacterium]|nr:PIN domain-containing protein [Acidobacteriota bacterium]